MSQQQPDGPGTAHCETQQTSAGPGIAPGAALGEMASGSGTAFGESDSGTAPGMDEVASDIGTVLRDNVFRLAVNCIQGKNRTAALVAAIYICAYCLYFERELNKHEGR